MLFLKNRYILGIFISTLVNLGNFPSINSQCCARSATILVPKKVNGKIYINEADREENEVHHHYEYPESSWKQQHETQQLVGEGIGYNY